VDLQYRNGGCRDLSFNRPARDIGFPLRLHQSVHDELVFDVFNEELESLKPLIRSEMENAYQLSIPLVVDLGEGTNWLEAH
jgi:DNA polymerase-1